MSFIFMLCSVGCRVIWYSFFVLGSCDLWVLFVADIFDHIPPLHAHRTFLLTLYVFLFHIFVHACVVCSFMLMAICYLYHDIVYSGFDGVHRQRIIWSMMPYDCVWFLTMPEVCVYTAWHERLWNRWRGRDLITDKWTSTTILEGHRSLFNATCEPTFISIRKGRGDLFAFSLQTVMDPTLNFVTDRRNRVQFVIYFVISEVSFKVVYDMVVIHNSNGNSIDRQTTDDERKMLFASTYPHNNVFVIDLKQFRFCTI